VEESQNPNPSNGWKSRAPGNENRSSETISFEQFSNVTSNSS